MVDNDDNDDNDNDDDRIAESIYIATSDLYIILIVNLVPKLTPFQTYEFNMTKFNKVI